MNVPVVCFVARVSNLLSNSVTALVFVVVPAASLCCACVSHIACRPVAVLLRVQAGRQRDGESELLARQARAGACRRGEGEEGEGVFQGDIHRNMHVPQYCTWRGFLLGL